MSNCFHLPLADFGLIWCVDVVVVVVVVVVVCCGDDDNDDEFVVTAAAGAATVAAKGGVPGPPPEPALDEAAQDLKDSDDFLRVDLEGEEGD